MLLNGLLYLTSINRPRPAAARQREAPRQTWIEAVLGSKAMNETEYLLLCWNDQSLEVIGIDALPDQINLRQGVELENACRHCGEACFTGFVDYLRRGGQIIGVRFTPFTPYEFIVDKKPQQSFLEVDSNSQSLLVFWAKTRLFEDENSGDQEFGGNKLYRNEYTGHRALTVRRVPEMDFRTIELSENVRIEA